MKTRGQRRNSDHYSAKLFSPEGQVSTIGYKPSNEDFIFMGMALDEAKLAVAEGNPAVGAVIVAGHGSGQNIYRGHSTEKTDRDLRRHAEMNAYDKAQSDLGLDLSSGALYVTLEPCEMCGHVYAQGHIGKIVIAATRADTPNDHFRPKRWNFEERLQDAGRTVMVVTGVRLEESLELFTPETKVHTSGG